MNLHNPWGKGFLSWDRKNHVDFVKELNAKLATIGIDLVISSDSDSYYQFAVAENEKPDDSSTLKYFVLVLMTEDYVRCRECLTDLLAIQQNRRLRLPWTIYYPNDHETHDKNAWSRIERYAGYAGETLDIPESLRLDAYSETSSDMTIFEAVALSFHTSRLLTLEPHKYNYNGGDVKKNECAFMESKLCPALQVLNPMTELPLLKKIYKLLKAPQGVINFAHLMQLGVIKGHKLVYVGIMGTSPRDRQNMTLIAQTLSPIRAEVVSQNTLFRYVKNVDPLVSGDNLQAWGAQLFRTVLGTSSETYQQLRNDISNSRNDYLLVIDNLGHYDQLKQVAKVFEFSSPQSKLLFTTTNPDFFPKHVQWNTLVDDDSQLRLFSFEGKISEPDVQAKAAEMASGREDLLVKMIEEQQAMLNKLKTGTARGKHEEFSSKLRHMTKKLDTKHLGIISREDAGTEGSSSKEYTKLVLELKPRVHGF